MRRPSNFVSLIGQRFDRLVVQDEVPKEERTRQYEPKYLCLCDCGNTVKVIGGHLRNGNTRSCGCLHIDKITHHGMHKHPMYNSWVNMKSRCDSPSSVNFAYYGGRGITYCEKWHVFEGFLEDMQEGWAKGLSLDRIHNDGNYCKENCRWANRAEQSRNKRNIVNITINGVTKCLTDWAKIYGLSDLTCRARIRTGWDAVEAVTTPARKRE